MTEEVKENSKKKITIDIFEDGSIVLIPEGIHSYFELIGILDCVNQKKNEMAKIIVGTPEVITNMALTELVSLFKKNTVPDGGSR